MESTYRQTSGVPHDYRNHLQVIAAFTPHELSIENIDLAIIIGNLLNNGIEATTQLEAVQQDSE